MMDRLTKRTVMGIVGNNASIKNYPLYKVAQYDELDRGITGQCFDKLAEYEDLEDRLNGISVQQVVDGFVKTIENQTCEGYEHGRILTNAEANQWNEYRQLNEQGLLLRLPCKVGDTVYSITNDGKIYPVEATREVRIVNGVLHIICESCRYSDLVSYDDIGKTVFLTQEEAEQKLKEMESDDMTIDEAIAKHRKIVETQKMLYDACTLKEHNSHFLQYAEEHEQLANWLEELKDYQDKNKMVVRIDVENMDSVEDKINDLSKYAESQYNKAIDDFVRFASDMPTVEEEDGTIRPMRLVEMAERLKAGGENDNLRR